jgi:hypothetical protein
MTYVVSVPFSIPIFFSKFTITLGKGIRAIHIGDNIEFADKLFHVPVPFIAKIIISLCGLSLSLCCVRNVNNNSALHAGQELKNNLRVVIINHWFFFKLWFGLALSCQIT